MRKLTRHLTTTLDRAAQRFHLTPDTGRHPQVIGSGIPLLDRPAVRPNPARSTTRTIDSGLTITHFSRGLS
ncbi:hypothetical protein [Streptomyces virginiae]|uniref:hypothetical protein n=1 Tax=Streptomyces virginiae TaxID=1961 RepID=UPI00225B6B11|nr:hypothetical protein [Streptomyces virginiae]MCX4960105.1 hypothetical protein [Streptomyces virginiae]